LQVRDTTPENHYILSNPKMRAIDFQINLLRTVEHVKKKLLSWKSFSN